MRFSRPMPIVPATITTAALVASTLVACAAPHGPAADTELLEPGSGSEGLESDGEEQACLDVATCLFDGDNTFGPEERYVQVVLPAEPRGAPVVFVWHYLHGSPAEMLAWMGVEKLTDAGYIVVAPASLGLPSSEWTLTGRPESNPDVALFDALLDQLTDQYAIDPERVYATGFSAGGLFTSYLTMHRADVLAATAPFSGGVTSSTYATPAAAIPVMLTWGGDRDSYGGFSFAEASETFVEFLLADGHEVVTCLHSQGHWLPADAEEHVLAFVDDHGGPDERPWSEATGRVPEGCEVEAP